MTEPQRRLAHAVAKTASDMYSSCYDDAVANPGPVSSHPALMSMDCGGRPGSPDSDRSSLYSEVVSRKNPPRLRTKELNVAEPPRLLGDGTAGAPQPGYDQNESNGRVPHGSHENRTSRDGEWTTVSYQRSRARGASPGLYQKTSIRSLEQSPQRFRQKMAATDALRAPERIFRRDFRENFEMGRSPSSPPLEKASEGGSIDTPFEGGEPTERELALHAELTRLRAQYNELVSSRSEPENRRTNRRHRSSATAATRDNHRLTNSEPLSSERTRSSRTTLQPVSQIAPDSHLADAFRQLNDLVSPSRNRFSEGSAISGSSDSSLDVPRRKTRRHGRHHSSKSRWKPRDPTPYDGSASITSFHKFLRESQEYIKGYNIPPTMYASTLAYFLTDTAYDFFTLHVSRNPAEWTLRSFFEGLFNFCFPVNFRLTQRERLRQCCQGDRSVMVFVHELEELILTAGITAKEDRVLYLWNGLRPYLQKQLWMFEYSPTASSWQDVVDAATRFEIAEAAGRSVVDTEESVSSEDEYSSDGYSKSETYSDTHDEDTDDDEDDGGFNSESGRSVSPPRAALSYHDRRQYMVEGRCFLCAEVGHIARDCPNDEVSQSSDSAEDAEGVQMNNVHIELTSEDPLADDEVYPHLDGLQLSAAFVSDDVVSPSDRVDLHFEERYSEHAIFNRAATVQTLPPDVDLEGVKSIAFRTKAPLGPYNGVFCDRLYNLQNQHEKLIPRYDQNSKSAEGARSDKTDIPCDPTTHPIIHDSKFSFNPSYTSFSEPLHCPPHLPSLPTAPETRPTFEPDLTVHAPFPPPVLSMRADPSEKTIITEPSIHDKNQHAVATYQTATPNPTISPFHPMSPLDPSARCLSTNNHDGSITPYSRMSLTSLMRSVEEPDVEEPERSSMKFSAKDTGACTIEPEDISRKGSHAFSPSVPNADITIISASAVSSPAVVHHSLPLSTSINTVDTQADLFEDMELACASPGGRM